MALRIGKKSNADDWSEESLRQELAQISGQGNNDEATVADAAPTAEDPLAELLADMPDASNAAPAPSTPVSTPTATAEPAVVTEPDVVPSADTARRTPKVSPILLAGGLVFLIVAAAVGVWLTFFNKPAEDESAAPVIAQRPTRPNVPRPGTPPPATSVLPSKATAPKTVPPKVAVPKAAATPAVPKNKVVPSKTPVKRVLPGKAGITPKAGKAPVVAARKPGTAPRVVPVKGVPTPVVPPPGMAGQPGKGSTRTTTVQIVRPVTVPGPALARQLKALWNEGAAAKHRGDIAGARRAWTKILQLHPGHPGIQEALDKLPK